MAQLRRPVRAGQIAAAVRDTLGSAWFKARSPSYQVMIRRHADDIATRYGDLMLRAVKAQHIEADLALFDPNPANDRLKAWRAIFNVARMQPNPALDVKRREVTVEGFAAWDADDLAAFRGRWPVGAVQRAAFELLLWTAARTNDAVTLGSGHVGPDGILSFVQSKTGGRAYVPWTNPLPEYAEGWADERAEMHAALGALRGGGTFLAAAGRQRSVKGLGNLVADAAREAGLKGRTVHGLRKARLTAIAEAGGTSHAIIAWGGHASLAEVEHYTKAAQMRRLVSRDAGRNAR